MVQVNAENDLHLTVRYMYPDGKTNETEQKVKKDVRSLRHAIMVAVNNPPWKFSYEVCRCALDYTENNSPLTRELEINEEVTENTVYFERCLGKVIKSLTLEEPQLKLIVEYQTPLEACTMSSQNRLKVRPNSDNAGNETILSENRTSDVRDLYKDITNNAKNEASLSANQTAETKDVYKDLSNNTETAEPSFVGLVNQAMTCYLNSLLQALYMTPEFRNALYKWEYRSTDNSESSSIPYQLQKLFLNLQTSSKAAVETTSLTRSFGWDSSEAWHQHDIQELCRVMFDALEHKFKNTAQADLINKLYEGKINDYVKCLSCNTEKFREDTFLDIPLPVRPFDNNVAYGSVEEALEAFVKYETLEGSNQYFCEKCNKKCNAHKGLKFTKFPYILTLQLKRFDFDQNSYHRIKLNDRITFPDVLNLNSFIVSTSTQESPNRGEDPGMSVKYEDICTTYNNTIDEEYASCEIILNSDYATNYDQDVDEGIDMSNGMSFSSCSMNNHNADKIRYEYVSTKGPYIYELFSIMIHSGSASGGHYYAYIKDFRTDKWWCFNDQSVSPISQDEIQKTYGGGSRTAFYSGAYRSSTNAYMLMYRRIDRERNAEPIEARDFPPHIKELLEKIKRYEDDRNYPDDQMQMERRFRKAVYFRKPLTKTVEQVTVSICRSFTLEQVAELAYKKTGIEHLVDLDQCRIVTYLPKYDIIDSTYAQDLRLDALFITQRMMAEEFLLDIRETEKFDIYPSDLIVTKLYVIDPVDMELADGPKYVRAYQNQTVREYKQELQKVFNLDPTVIQLFCRQLTPHDDKLLEDDMKLQITHVKSYLIISATTVCDTDKTKNVYESFIRMSDHLNDIITFYVEDVDKEQLENQNIPSLAAYYREKKTQENSSSYNSYPTEKLSKLKVSSLEKNKSFERFRVPRCNNLPVMSMEEFHNLQVKSNVSVADREDWTVPETSNSEDSSLSDSDKTLVEEGADDIEFNNESALSFSPCRYLLPSTRNQDSKLEKFFKVTYLNDQKLWKVSMDDRTLEDELKEKLEVYLKIPKDYFKFEDTSDDYGSYIACSKVTFKEDRKYSIVLGRVINADEMKMDVFLLDMSNPEPLRKIGMTVFERNCRVGKVKRQLLRDNNIDIPYDKWRFLDHSGNAVCGILEDDEEALTRLLFSDGICIQEWPPDGFDPQTQFIFYVRRWNRSQLQIEDVEEIIVYKDNFNEELKNKISSNSCIPVENLEFSRLVLEKNIEIENIEYQPWQLDLKLEDFKITYVLYRDTRETPKKISDKLEGHYQSSSFKDSIESSERYLRRRRFELSTTNYASPRKEKPLKIIVDST